MRIVGGELRGRTLASFRGSGIRPTTDRVREAVFSIIAPYGPFDRVLDLFAGTGAMGIEALSRGAAAAVFVDRSPASVRVIRQNIELCSLSPRASVLTLAAARAIERLDKKGECFDLVFVDPPYDDSTPAVEALKAIDASRILNPGALVVVETPARHPPPWSGPDGGGGPGRDADVAGRLERLALVDDRRYGDTAISIFVQTDDRPGRTDG